MNDFLKETKKRQKEQERVNQVNKKFRVISQKLLDELDAFSVMLSMTFDNLKLDHTKFEIIISELEQDINIYGSVAGKSMHSVYQYLYQYVSIPKSMSIRKIKGDKSIIKLAFNPSEQTMEKLNRLKNVKITKDSSYYHFNYFEITISNLDKMLDSKLFIRMLMLLVKEIATKEEVT